MKITIARAKEGPREAAGNSPTILPPPHAGHAADDIRNDNSFPQRRHRAISATAAPSHHSRPRLFSSDGSAPQSAAETTQPR